MKVSVPKMRWIKIGEDWKSLPENGPAWFQPTSVATGQPVRPVLRCRCGEVLPDLNLHHVMGDGRIEPSVHHSDLDCDWLAFVTLEGYNGNEYKPEL